MFFYGFLSEWEGKPRENRGKCFRCKTANLQDRRCSANGYHVGSSSCSLPPQLLGLTSHWPGLCLKFIWPKLVATVSQPCLIALGRYDLLFLTFLSLRLLSPTLIRLLSCLPAFVCFETRYLGHVAAKTQVYLDTCGWNFCEKPNCRGGRIFLHCSHAMWDGMLLDAANTQLVESLSVGRRHGGAPSVVWTKSCCATSICDWDWTFFDGNLLWEGFIKSGLSSLLSGHVYI